MKNILFWSLIGVCLISVSSHGAEATDSISVWSENSHDIAIDRVPIQYNPEPMDLFPNEEDKLAQLLLPRMIMVNLMKKSNIDSLNSHRILLPSTVAIPQDDFITYIPPKKDNVEWWNLQMVDSQGRTVKEFKGKNTPPSIFKWDGLQEGWNRIKLGESYSFHYATKEFGKIRKETSDPFHFNVFQQASREAIHIYLNGQNLYTGVNNSKLSEMGKQWVLAAGQNILIHAGKPVRIRVISKNLAEAKKLRDQLVQTLSQYLIRNPDEFVTEVEVDVEEKSTVIVSILGGKS